MAAKSSRRRSRKGRLREPYRQGDLDGLCGVYSAINAVRALCPEIDGDDASWLFDHLVRYLANNGNAASGAVANGIGCGDEARVLMKAVRYLADEHDIDLRLSRLPKALRRAADIDRLWQALGEAVSSTCVAVLGLAGRHEHWTVAVDVSPQQIRLYDSGEISALRRRQCTLRKTTNGIRLTPVQVFLIERRDAQEST